MFTKGSNLTNASAQSGLPPREPREEGHVEKEEECLCFLCCCMIVEMGREGEREGEGLCCMS
jgi:hypothetical protein